jgi:hypothetical protein
MMMMWILLKPDAARTKPNLTKVNLLRNVSTYQYLGKFQVRGSVSAVKEERNGVNAYPHARGPGWSFHGGIRSDESNSLKRSTYQVDINFGMSQGTTS